MAENCRSKFKNRNIFLFFLELMQRAVVEYRHALRVDMCGRDWYPAVLFHVLSPKTALFQPPYSSFINSCLNGFLGLGQIITVRKGILQNNLPFSIYNIFAGSGQSPFFEFTRYLRDKTSIPF